MDNLFNAVDITGTTQLILSSQARAVYEQIKDFQFVYLDMKHSTGCTTGFIMNLVYLHQQRHKFAGRIAFFNVENPIVAMKILEAYRNLATEQIANDYIQLISHLLDEENESTDNNGD